MLCGHEEAPTSPGFSGQSESIGALFILVHWALWHPQEIVRFQDTRIFKNHEVPSFENKSYSRYYLIGESVWGENPIDFGPPALYEDKGRKS